MNDSPIGDRGATAADTASKQAEEVFAQDLGRVARGSTINFIGSIVRTVLTFLYAFFLASFLDESSVGLFFLGFSALMLLGTAATLGLDTGILRFTALYNGEGDAARVRGTITGALIVAVPVSILVALVLYFFAGPIGSDIFGEPGLPEVLKIFSPGIVLFVLAKLFNSGTQGLRYMRYQVYSRDFGEQLTRFIMSAGFLIAGLGIYSVVGANIAALAIAVALSFYYLQKVMPLYGGGRERRYEQRRLLLYSAPIAGSTLLSLLLLWTDTILLGYFGTAQEVGIYSVARRLAVVGTIIVVSFNTIFAPLASDLHNRGQHMRLEKLLKSVTKWSLAFSLPFFALLAIYAEQAMRIMGTQYTAGAAALAILAVSQLITASVGPGANLLMMCGKPRFVLVSNMFVFLVDILLCIILIPRFGIEGAALAFAITLTLFNVVVSAAMILLLKLQPFSAGYIRIIGIGAIATALALLLLRQYSGAAGYALSAAAFGASYFLVAYLGAFDETDMQVFKSIREGRNKSR